ncbi:ATP-binding protein [Chengkuizengella axinellae]|uniref:histidine kinase n=1 Tax=Chengkuizengella axinellae TaxID=3064388 RepID=A0ABT9IT90_9BACL|nr:HAMP domain-containing sensor histidine kinase [Chengkuizengella sp. 2205SS18-9]MDP5272555.1 HAMP domain-containing sensor histidine kinase [Chengkuizengella sp. 2205SS18-9]
MWQLFRLKLIHAIIISVVGYVVYGLLQTILFLSYKPDISLFSNEVYLLQTLTAFIAFVISFILKKYNLGYSFILNERASKEASTLKVATTLIFLLGFIVVGPMYYFLYNSLIFLYALFSILVVITLFFIVTKKWEQEFKQQVLNKTLKAMDTGTSIINHTIKNEVAKINVLVSQLSEQTKGNLHNENVKNTINQILKSTEHMNEMTVRIKEKTEDVQIIISKIVIPDLIDEVISSLHTVIEGKHIKFNIMKMNDTVVYGDQIHIKEVICNIINNSIEAVKKGSDLQINIGVKEDKKYIHLFINDNGTGIPKQIQNKVFDPFYTTKKSSNNHGLGLSYAFNIMKKHGGDLIINSEVDHGTEVVMRFLKKNSSSKIKVDLKKDRFFDT